MPQATSYQGDAELLLDGKLVAKLRVSLWYRRRGVLGQWGGSALPYDENELPPVEPASYTLRTSEGEGNALISNVRLTADARGARMSFDIVGSGPAPF